MKRQAQIAGLGVGHLPRHLIQADLDAGRLVVKATEEGRSNYQPAYAIWRTRNRGNGLAWFQRALSGPEPIDWFS